MDRPIIVILSASLALSALCLSCSAGTADPVQGSTSGGESRVVGQTPIPVQIPFTFDKAKAWAHLLKQCAFGPRTSGTEAHRLCRDWLLEEVKNACGNSRLQPFSHRWSQSGKTINMWNVIGDQNWKDATTRVVVLAHWDTRPTADMEYDYKNQKKPILGANDGASGVAVLLELMRVTKDKLPKDLGVMYLLVDGEDLGPNLDEMFLGAAYFSKNPGALKPDYGILIDMIGDKNLSIPMEPNSDDWASPLLKAFYQNASKAGLGKWFPQTWGTRIEDDHIPMNQNGIPTIDLIDFTYDAWHTLADTPDKCSPDSLEHVGAALETWLMKTPVWKYPVRN